MKLRVASLQDDSGPGSAPRDTETCSRGASRPAQKPPPRAPSGGPGAPAQLHRGQTSLVDGRTLSPHLRHVHLLSGALSRQSPGDRPAPYAWPSVTRRGCENGSQSTPATLLPSGLGGGRRTQGGDGTGPPTGYSPSGTLPCLSCWPACPGPSTRDSRQALPVPGTLPRVAARRSQKSHPPPSPGLTLIADEAGPALGAVTAVQAREAGPPILTVVTREAAILAKGGVQADWGQTGGGGASGPKSSQTQLQTQHLL